MEKKILTISSINGVIVGLIILLDFLFFREISGLFSSILLLAVIMFIVPIVVVRYYYNWRIKSLEDYFPQFVRDLAESIKAGMTLPQAVDSISTNDYGNLSSHVKKLNAQLEWGIPFDKAFMNFARGTRSKLISRISSTIIQSHEFGGNLIDILESISKTAIEIERLREERKLYMHSQLITGYVIFFVFLVVVIGLEKYLVPSLTQASVTELTQPVTSQVSEEYKTLFRNLTIIQGFFAGLVIGKLSEGSMSAGIKHSLFLIIIGIVIYTLATSIL